MHGNSLLVLNNYLDEVEIKYLVIKDNNVGSTIFVLK